MSLLLILIFGGVIYFLIYWRRLLLESMMPFDGNMLRLFYPSWVVGKRLLTAGSSLLWDPYRNLGQPFLADPQNQALYPLRFFSLFLSFLDYQRVFVVFHVLLAAVPAFVLAKRLFRNDESAALAALTLGFSGFSLARVTVPAHFATMAWAPLLLLLLHLRRPLWLGVALALQWLAGFPPFFLLSLVTLILFSFISSEWKISLVCVAKGTLVALGLTAIQWLPFLEMLNASSRSVLLTGMEAVEYSIHPFELLRQTVLPSFLLTSLPPLTDSDPAMIGFYVGPILLGLIGLGAWRSQRRERVFLAMSAMGLIMALGRYNGFYRFVPFVSVFRFPAHWILLATLGFSFLAAQGLSQLKNKNLRRGLFGLVAVDLLLYAFPMHTAWGDLDFFSQAPIRLQGLDDVPEGSRIFHSSLITERVHTWQMGAKEDWLFFKGSLVPSVGVAYGLKEAVSYNVLMSRRHIAFLDRLNHSVPSSPLFDYAGISKIISLTKEGAVKPMPTWTDGGVFENPDYKRVAFMETGARVIPLTNLPGDVTVQTEGPGTLVLSEAYAPGWRAEIDGTAASVGIFEEEFSSVALPAGTHNVRFFYKPASFRYGRMISIAAIVAILLATL